MRTREYRYYNNEKQILLSIHLKNNFDYLLTNGITMEWDCNQLATAKVVFEIFR